jgi:hypothetical protein
MIRLCASRPAALCRRQNEQLGTLPLNVKLDVVTPVPDGVTFELYRPTVAY